MATSVLKFQDEFPESGAFSYPATTDYAIIKGANNEIHILLGQGPPSTNHNNAPLSSLYVDVTNYFLYIHTATATWIKVGLQT